MGEAPERSRTEAGGGRGRDERGRLEKGDEVRRERDAEGKDGGEKVERRQERRREELKEGQRRWVREVEETHRSQSGPQMGNVKN